jgi:hypothetical protein
MCCRRLAVGSRARGRSARNPLLWIVIYVKAPSESYLFGAGPSGEGGICALRDRPTQK